MDPEDDELRGDAEDSLLLTYPGGHWLDELDDDESEERPEEKVMSLGS